MKFCRLLIVFLIIGIGAIHAESTKTDEKVLCDDDVKSTPAPIASTTPQRPCGKLSGVTPFKRKKGYWCVFKFDVPLTSDTPLSYKPGAMSCEVNGYVVSSIESEEEYISWQKMAVNDKVGAYWVGAGYNVTTQQYFWNDTHAVPTMSDQPTVDDPNGHVAWFVNTNKSVPGYGSMHVVSDSGTETPFLRSVICGAPGLQFD